MSNAHLFRYFKTGAEIFLLAVCGCYRHQPAREPEAGHDNFVRLHPNRPVLMTNATKSVVWRASYEPFGAVHQITGPAANDNRFPGQLFQLESGLAYNWHRHYDSTTGRYTQADSLGLTAMLSDGPRE
jgi:RHS repeat-associated protein